MTRNSKQGMNVSGADIMAVFEVVFSHPMPQTLAFVTAAEAIRDTRPNDWQDLFKRCARLRAEFPEDTYSQRAARMAA